MSTHKLVIGIVIRTLIIAILIAVAIYCGIHSLWYVLTSICIFLLILVFETRVFIKRYYSKFDSIVQAMLYDDYALSFEEQKENTVLNQLIRLYEKNKKASFDLQSQAFIYQQLLNSLESGVLILKKSTDSWTVLNMNEYLRKYFGLPGITYWHQFKSFVPQFYEAIEDKNFAEYKSTIDIQINKEEKQTFVIQTSVSKVGDQQYYIILLDSIQRVIDSTENEAWLSIMKVIAHELMNSLTPIHSLAGNVSEILEQESLSAEDKEDVQVSVDTILNRSYHLQKFVERYRRLTMLPSPQPEWIAIDTLIQNCLRGYTGILQQKEITLHYNGGADIRIFADAVQMEQVLINLFTNSMYAVESQDIKDIFLQVYTLNKRVYIEFADSGRIIDPEIVPRIFLPFYTTRKDGGGIGLTLSKSIVEAHGGYLFYQIKADRNTFVLALPVTETEV